MWTPNVKKERGGRAMSPPRIVINWTDFDKLCAMQCTVPEIAGWFDCGESTIKRAVKRAKRMTFQEYAGAKRLKGNISIRRAQFELAMSGDKTMLIWLGKQYLGQQDRQQHEHSGPNGAAITHAVTVRFVRPGAIDPTAERAP